MDLSKLDTKKAAGEGATMQLSHPVTGEPLKSDDGRDMTIDLLGSDSSEYRQYIKSAATRNAARGKKKLSAEDFERESIALLAKLTMGWDGIVLEGEELKYTYAAAVDLYERFLWIREQVDEFIVERGNFLASA